MSPMGHLGCLASFQHFMEFIICSINNVIIYINDILIHTKIHNDPLGSLYQVFNSLKSNHLKTILDRHVFGNKVFILTSKGIKSGLIKLKAINCTKLFINIKTIRSFVGLCNFFRTNIKDVTIIAAPLFCLTRQDSGCKGGPLQNMPWMLLLSSKICFFEPVAPCARTDCLTPSSQILSQELLTYLVGWEQYSLNWMVTIAFCHLFHSLVIKGLLK
jgi:hypothetical protein